MLMEISKRLGYGFHEKATSCCCKGCCRKAVRKLSLLDGAESCGGAVKGQFVNVKTFQTCMRREGRKKRGRARKREK